MLLAEGRAPARCSCDRDRRRWEDSTQGPADRPAGSPSMRPPSRKLLLAEEGRGAGLPCSVLLPPLWQRRLDTGVQTVEPPGRHGERQRASSSGSDRERQ